MIGICRYERCAAAIEVFPLHALPAVPAKIDANTDAISKSPGVPHYCQSHMAPVRPNFVQSRSQMTLLTLNQFQHASLPTSNGETHRKSLLPSFRALLSPTAPNRYCLTTSFLYRGYLIYLLLTPFPLCQQ